ncbi:unnamed protein product [Vitrella brassicaformis CCMP3155]|uniref:Uncharacterized protein n=1 Tax=Vitrella brassicaformis (strain CCMP3155) TaxID=1169540 RepID=A0A0G4H3I2_VITBC|nr:unnamed protein product [Vitrella brassicaformis CCMP3155]|eukprot:CEM38179.1 unnamed protein product [Vitrella brassicaformis CCMP3155]
MEEVEDISGRLAHHVPARQALNITDPTAFIDSGCSANVVHKRELFDTSTLRPSTQRFQLAKEGSSVTAGGEGIVKMTVRDDQGNWIRVWVYAHLVEECPLTLLWQNSGIGFLRSAKSAERALLWWQSSTQIKKVMVTKQLNTYYLTFQPDTSTTPLPPPDKKTQYIVERGIIPITLSLSTSPRLINSLKALPSLPRLPPSVATRHDPSMDDIMLTINNAIDRNADDPPPLTGPDAPIPAPGDPTPQPSQSSGAPGSSGDGLLGGARDAAGGGLTDGCDADERDGGGDDDDGDDGHGGCGVSFNVNGELRVSLKTELNHPLNLTTPFSLRPGTNLPMSGPLSIVRQLSDKSTHLGGGAAPGSELFSHSGGGNAVPSCRDTCQPDHSSGCC